MPLNLNAILRDIESAYIDAALQHYDVADVSGHGAPAAIVMAMIRAVLPKACPICRRIEIEADIVTRTVDALLAAGYALQVDDGGRPEERRPAEPTTDRAVILAELMETDEDYLLAVTPGLAVPRGWVRFVYGNDGHDVICDYSTSLEDVLKPINEYADSLI